MTNYVYFIRALDRDIFKIGASHNPARRLLDLQVGCPYHLHIHDTILCKDGADLNGKEYHYILESYLKDSCVRENMQGEWFRLTPPQVDMLIKEVTQGWRLTRTSHWLNPDILPIEEDFSGWKI